MRINFKALALSATLATLIAIGVARAFYGNAVVAERRIELSAKALEEFGSAKIIDSLVLPHIKHRAAFRLYAKRLNLVDTIKRGSYELRRGQDVVELVRMLKLGVQSPVKLIFNNARGAEQLAGRIAKQIESDSAAIVEALNSRELSEEIGLKPHEMISIFIPNTYEVWWTISPEELVRRMYRESDIFWNESRENKRKALNLSRVEVVTLASIVYEESSKESEYSTIAGVYGNRLRRRMKLQADPTIKYALNDFTIKRVMHKHLSYDSPYNTYKYYGLPPAPIAIPSIAAIDGVLNRERHNYLFFCARPEMDGYHNFATTYSEHLTNAKAYAAKLNELGVE